MRTNWRDLSHLLGQLGPLDQQLDVFLLSLALVDVSPPDGSLVFTAQAEVFAGFAERLSLVALLPAKTASEAS